MNPHKVFWQGVLMNTAKALVLCTLIYLINKQQFDLGVEFPSIGTFLVGIGVILTGVITSYAWRGLGFSNTKIWFRAVVLDWIGTLIFMLLSFEQDAVAMFIYFSIFIFWIFLILIALGIWLGNTFLKTK